MRAGRAAEDNSHTGRPRGPCPSLAWAVEDTGKTVSWRQGSQGAMGRSQRHYEPDKTQIQSERAWPRRSRKTRRQTHSPNTGSMKRLSEILYLKVVTEDRKFLGHAIDFRSAGEPEHGDSRDERAVDEIVYAHFGMLERLGLKKAGEKTIP